MNPLADAQGDIVALQMIVALLLSRQAQEHPDPSTWLDIQEALLTDILDRFTAATPHLEEAARVADRARDLFHATMSLAKIVAAGKSPS